MIRSSVDLPQPEAPTSVRNSPSAMSRSIPVRTSTLPNDFPTPRSSTLAMLGLVHGSRRLCRPPRRIDLVQDVVDPVRRKPRDVVMSHRDVAAREVVDGGAEALVARHLGLVVGTDQK